MNTSNGLLQRETRSKVPKIRSEEGPLSSTSRYEGMSLYPSSKHTDGGAGSYMLGFKEPKAPLLWLYGLLCFTIVVVTIFFVVVFVFRDMSIEGVNR